MIEDVFKQRDNKNILSFDDDGTVLDFSTATRMVLKFRGSDIEADSDVDSSLIDWTIGGGVVEFSIGGLDIPNGSELSSSLIVYDPLHSEGQILVHSDNNELYFRFIDPI